MAGGRVSTTTRAPAAPVRQVEAVIGTPPAREVVPHDPRSSTRWHRHDYPSPYSRWNYHPEYELHLITRGTGWCIIGDTIESFGPGQLVLVGPELPHEWVSDVAPGESVVGRDVVLQFHDSWIRSCAAVMPELADLDAVLASSTRGIEFLGGTALRAAALLEQVGRTSGTQRLGTTFTLLHALASAPQDERRYLANDWIPAVRGPEDAEAVNRTLEYVVADLTGEVRLSRAAAMAGMSESAFSRYFKAASGHTFSDVVKRVRLAHACKRLTGTTDPVSVIAHAVGYRNLSNFNRQFLAEVGCTPVQYRRRERAR